MNPILHHLHTPVTPSRTRTSKMIGACATLSAAGLFLVLAAGCHSTNDKVHGEDFANGKLTTDTARIFETQAAAGARADGMLHARDFDGGAINSLGRSKLDLMIQDEHAITPLVVYLDLPEADALTKARHDSTVLFLKDRGLLDSQIEIKSGINPDSLAPAQPNLVRLPKTESSAEAGADKPAAAGASAAH
jgi:hypothetical protein